MRLIKRYPNRKLYDVNESRYIKLDEIGKLIREGTEIKVVDSKNDEDLTSVTMAHVLLEEGKKKNWLPIQTIKSILMTGSEKLGRKISTPVVSLKEEAERKVRKMHSDAVDDLKELITGTQKAYDDVQKMAEERIGIVLKALSGFSGTNNEIKNLRDEVKKLRKRVENLEKTLKEHR